MLNHLTRTANNLGVIGESKRWMASHDVGKNVLSVRWGLRFIVELALTLQHSNPFIGVTDNALSLKDIQQRFKGNGQLVTNYLLHCEDLFTREKVRLNAMRPFRRYHGDRIREDREGLSSMELGIKWRVKWATGHWVGVFSDVLRSWAETEAVYVEWAVGVAGEGGVDVEYDPSLTELLENIGRVFAAKWVGQQIIWDGGIYSLAALFGDGEVARSEAARAKVVLAASLRFEEEVSRQPHSHKDFATSIIFSATGYIAVPLLSSNAVAGMWRHF